jgi:hypothetical protein
VISEIGRCDSAATMTAGRGIGKRNDDSFLAQKMELRGLESG